MLIGDKQFAIYNYSSANLLIEFDMLIYTRRSKLHQLNIIWVWWLSDLKITIDR